MNGWLSSIDPHLAFWTIAVGVVANVSCALLGCYLVLRRMSLLGDAISHAVLPGIAVAFLLIGQVTGPGIVLGAMALGLLTSFLTQTLHSSGGVPEDASMGVVFTSLFALGVILITRAAAHADLDAGCVLYGLIEFVPLDTVPVLGIEVPRAMITLAFALLLTLGFIALLWKELKITSFDPALATAMGISATAVHYSLMAMVAGVTVAAFEAVGSILVVAMLIVPAATAQLLTDRLRPMLAWSAAVAALGAVGGYFFAAAWNTSVAGMMAVVVGAQFALAVFVAPRHGIASRWLENLRLALRIAREDVMARLFRAEEASQRGEPISPRASAMEARQYAGGLASWLAVPHLWLRGEIAYAQRHVELTQRGRQRARDVVRAHRLWEAYLGEHFDLPLDHLHAPAERMEHFIDPDLQQQLAEALAQPRHDPHGRDIPQRAANGSAHENGSEGAADRT